MEAADEIGLAVIATTFTLVAVFLPTAFMGGVPGKFFKQFGWTAALAVLRLAGGRAHADADDGGLHPASRRRTTQSRRPAGCARYMRWVRWCLRHRVLTTIGVGSCSSSARSRSMPLLPTGFIPPDDRVADAGQHRAAARLHARSRRARRPKQARAGVDARTKHVKQRLHHHRRRRAGGDPFAPRRRGRGAQGGRR